MGIIIIILLFVLWFIACALLGSFIEVHGDDSTLLSGGLIFTALYLIVAAYFGIAGWIASVIFGIAAGALHISAVLGNQDKTTL